MHLNHEYLLSLELGRMKKKWISRNGKYSNGSLENNLSSYLKPQARTIRKQRSQSKLVNYSESRIGRGCADPQKTTIRATFRAVTMKLT